MLPDHIIHIHVREDGGLRISSPTEPGLILSGVDPKAVMACVWPGIRALQGYRAERRKRPPAGTILCPRCSNYDRDPEIGFCCPVLGLVKPALTECASYHPDMGQE